MVSSPVVTVLLFNAAKVLVEQQINVKIESIHFMDGWVHLNTQDTKTIDIEIGNIEEEITNMQDLRQRMDVGDRMNYDHNSMDLDCERDADGNNNYFDRHSIYNSKDVNETGIGAEINAVRPSPITPTLQPFSSSPYRYLCPSLSRIAEEPDEYIDTHEVQLPSVEITKYFQYKSASVTGTLVQRQPIRNVFSTHASHPYPQPRRRRASVKK